MIDGIKIISLQGDSYYEMGCAYGKQLKKELAYSKEVLISEFNVRGISYDQMLAGAEEFYLRYSPIYKDFLLGMAYSADLSLDDIKILNGMEALLGFVQCSFAYIGQDRTIDGQSLIGRNYDFEPEIYGKIAKNLVVTIMNDIVIIGMPGQFYCATGANKYGIFLELNNGMASGGMEVDHAQETMLTKMLEILQSCASLREVDQKLMGAKSDYSLIVTASDSKESIAYEFATKEGLGMRKCSNHGSNPSIYTNFFLSPEWQGLIPVPDDNTCQQALTRRNNLIILLEQKNKISVEMLQEIMSKPIDNKGVCDLRTLYQIIFQPSTLKLWLKRTHYDKEWLMLDLQEYFLSK